MYILGISALYHDAAAVLLKDGTIVGAVQEERFSRIKHDKALPLKSIRWLLEKEGITIADIEKCIFYEKPLRKFERILTTAVQYAPKSWRMFPVQMHKWLSDKLWQKGDLIKNLSISESKLFFCSHHLSHAASAFYCSPFTSSAILTIDGVGEWATTALWKGDENGISLHKEIRYPHSLGMFYSCITAHLGFAVNSGEYKVMGMAAFGKPTFHEEMKKLLLLHDDGSFSLDLSYFQYHLHPRNPTNKKFEELLGVPRHPAASFDPKQQESLHWANIAASAQLRLEEALLHLARHTKKETGSKNLCLAGGVALNSKANQKIAESGIFDSIFTQPAAGDAGGALGAALWGFHQLEKNPFTPKPFHINLGASYTVSEIRSLLEDCKISYEEITGDWLKQVSADLCSDLVVGFMQGSFEWGPRALGHRSILASPRKLDMAEHVNKKIKFREAFRPFAPICLEEEAQNWFSIPSAAFPMLPYMLCTVPVQPEQQSKIPSVCHVDGTARLQTVHKDLHPILHQLLQYVHDDCGIPILLNTSFNLKGDSMVASPADALSCFLQSGLDVVYMENIRITPPRNRSRYVG
ncbi:MAG: hypothetical protein CL916_10715 [Deltaproteobacteria bacterium]|nr:hypothetical protein [Deltaproteobacteria bacterium]